MWTCPECKQKFIYKNNSHSCNEKTVEDFLKGKPENIISLFNYFIDEYKKLGDFVLHPSKTRIAFASKIRFGYVHRIGQKFMDVVLTFTQPYEDNLCFYRIGAVPGDKYFQHYLRLYYKDDINDEVKKYMKMALEWGSR